jgi:hypothetical protein
MDFKLNSDLVTSDFDKYDDAVGMPVGPLPKSSKVNIVEEAPKNILHDLWIVGAGTLGEIIAKLYIEEFPNASIIAETKTTTRHSFYESINIKPRLRESRKLETDSNTAKHVIICIPPSSAKDYVTEVSDSTRLWAGPLGNGSLVYTSSIGVYGDSNGNTVNEKFRLDTRSESATK